MMERAKRGKNGPNVRSDDGAPIDAALCGNSGGNERNGCAATKTLHRQRGR